MEHSDYLLAKAVISSVFSACVNAVRFEEEGDQEAADRQWKQADFLALKFTNKYHMSASTYAEKYERYHAPSKRSDATS